MQIFEEIRNFVKQIPLGKVTTYGEIANAVGVDPRVVGWALCGNQNPLIPCHRVVKKNGLLATNFSLGGWKGQRQRLQKEGLRFKGPQILNFSAHFVTIASWPQIL